VSDQQEPEDGGYVAVHHFDDRFAVELFHRDARFARMLTTGPGEWVGTSGEAQVKTWQELTELGEIALRGAVRGPAAGERVSRRLDLTDMQKDILRAYSGHRNHGVTKHLLARARKSPGLAGQSGYTYLAAAVEMLDAGYFVEPTRWEVTKSALIKDDAPAELTDLGEEERERLDREDWR
jgi:hypothetical protein